MDGVRRCKQFLQSLNVDELKSIKVKIKRADIQGSNYPQVIYRGLEDPKSLVIHFRKETSHGIFDREDIVLNQEFYTRQTRSESVEFGKKRGRSPNYRNRNENKSRRSTSPTYRKDRSRSRSPRKRSYSPRRTSRRTRSPSPKPVKIPGLYIPPKSDYLRYEKRERNRSPGPSRPKSRSPINYRRSSKDRSRSPRRAERSKSRTRRSPSPKQSSQGTSRTRRSPSPKYSSREKTYKDRRSRTPNRSPRRNRSKSPVRNRREYRSRRSRSRSRHRERIVENEDFEKMMMPYAFQDGEYWMASGFFPPYIPRGFLPPPIVYPGPYPRMIMPRMPGRMPPPFRARTYMPRTQPSTSRSHEEDRNRTQEIPGVNENIDENNVNSGVTISEIIVEKDTEKN